MWSNISSPLKQEVAAETGPIKKQQQQHQENGNNNAESTINNNLTLQNATNNSNSGTGIGGSPLMRYKHAVCSSPNGYIYIHGGRFGNLPLDDDVWRFDPHQNSWLQLRTSGCKPPNLQEHSLVEHNEHLYLFGGQVSASDTENSFWSLDLLSGEWRSLSMISSKLGAHLGPTNRRGHSAVVHGDSMYIYGGFEDFRGSSNQLWEYNLLCNRWELRNLNASSSCQPEPRHSHSAIVYHDSMFVFGGLSNLKPLGDLWRWSWREKRWFKERTRGQSPGQLHGHTAVQAFDSMFVFGGERNGRPTRGLWRLNLSNMSWQKVRPKGPRPSPSTWHGAVANPLSILDEANYIVQGPDSSSELMISSSRDSCLSMSENCFVNSVSTTHHHHQYSSKTIRPMQSPNSIMMPKSSSSAEVAGSFGGHSNNPRSSSSMLLMNQVNNNLELACGTKRKSRLSFLRRNHRPKSTYELKQIQVSASVSNGLANSSEAHRYSAAATATTTTTIPEARVKIESDGTNVRILDNLDSDIKEMFERAELSPAELQREQVAVEEKPRRADVDIVCEDEPMAVDSSSHEPAARTISTSLTCRSSYYETARQPTTTDISSLRNSQRTSCASYTTPPSELNTLTEERPRVATHSFLWGDDAASGYDRRSNRPKSEIVQSLIERADARIKHLYTPYFNNQSAGGGSAPRSRNNRHRHSLDRSKRHTLPETMTYYNLYFSEDKSSSSPPPSSSQDANEQQVARQRTTMIRDDLSSSTLRAVGVRKDYGAALVGVHDCGDNNDSNNNNNDYNVDNDNKESQLSLVTTNSSSGGSRTICAETPHSSLAAALTCGTASSNHGGTMDHLDGADDLHLTSTSTMVPQNYHQADRSLRPDTAASESCDNTSMSFSVIAEFEEDDMLQYSSPTDPTLEYSPSNHRQTVVYNQRPNLQHAGEELVAQSALENAAPKSNSSGYDSISTGSDQQQQHQANRQLDRRNTPQRCSNHSDSAQDDSRTSLSPGAGYTTTETSPEQSAALRNQLKKLKPNQLQLLQRQQHQHSATVDSLALTSDGFDASTSNGGQQHALAKSLPPSSPPGSATNHVVAAAQQAAQVSAAQTRRKVPLRSKLFSGGRQKAKTRYWQLCMFVIGGKQGGAHGVNEPITIWRLYI